MTNNKQTWANLIYLHEPPLLAQQLQEVVEKSFFEITAIIKGNPEAKLNLAVSGNLLEDLTEHNLGLLVEEIRELAARGQIEFLATARSWPILPKLPKEEIRRQLETSNEISRRILGPVYKPEGALLPELAYSKDVAEVLTQIGVRWAVVPETSVVAADNSAVYTVKGLPLKVLLRSGQTSNDLSSGLVLSRSDFFSRVGLETTPNQYLLTVWNGEIFGYTHPGLQQLLDELYRDDKLESKFLTEIVATFPKGGEADLLASSGRSTLVEVERGAAYSTWQFPGNSIHTRQWQLVNLAVAAVWALSKMDSQYPTLRERLDRALHSDQFLWAGARPYWNFRLVEASAKELKNIVQESSGASLEDKEQATQIHREIMELGLRLYGDRIFGVKSTYLS